MPSPLPEILLDRSAGAPPLRTQVEARIAGLIGLGGLRPGDRLPPTRVLAAELGVSRGVVVSAYAQLSALGLVESRVGAETAVASAAGPGASSRATISDGAPTWRFDLDPEVPDIGAFPLQQWQDSLQRATTALPTRGLDYRTSRGLPELREALAAYLARNRAMKVDPDHIVLCGGIRQAIEVARQALRDAGTGRLAVPRVGHPISRLSFTGSTIPVSWLDVDDDGAVLRAETLARDHAILINPVHQYPLGTALSADRVDALCDSEALIIEDDSNATLRHDRAVIPAIQSKVPDRTVYVGSLSRTAAPGLRLGFLVAPPAITRAAVRIVALWGLSPSALDQIALTDFIDRGCLDAHIRTQRVRYRSRAAELTRLLAANLPEITPRAPASGFHLIVPLPAGTTEVSVLEVARRRQIRLRGMAAHVLAGSPLPPALVLGYGAVGKHQLADVAAELRNIVDLAVLARGVEAIR